jgi:hypothetical protein
MPTKDVFGLDDPLPLFLTDERDQQVLTDEPDQQGIGKAWDRTVIWSRLLKATILVATATAITIAILSAGNPVALFADVTASVDENSALQPGTDQSTPTVQSTADAKTLPPTAKDAPSRDEIAAAFKSALQPGTDQSTPTVQSTADAKTLPPTAKDAPSREAAEKDARAHVGRVQQSVQDTPAKAAGETRASLRLMHKHRHVRPVHNARAEMRLAQNPRKKVRREQNARVQVPSAQDAPAQDAPAQDQYVQNPFLKIFDWRN